LSEGSKDTLCNKKRRGLKDESRERVRHSHTQCQNDQSEFGIIPGLNRRIPAIEHLQNRTNKARQQSNCNRYSRRPRAHAFEYSAARPQVSNIYQRHATFSATRYVTHTAALSARGNPSVVKTLRRQDGAKVWLGHEVYLWPTDLREVEME
jgi:hypothetical protein